ncbi:MAG: transposase [Planctomycetales bacterium]|nr:transposase [bacterium]UNM08248.1 MAG: transposase [Planctomycetales bacterium]
MNRKSPRLKYFDYSTPGAYVITIATLQRRKVLAVERSGCLELTEVGREVAECWRGLGRYHANTLIDHFAVMPDHFHGIVFLNLPWLEGYRADRQTNLCNLVKSFKNHTQKLANEILVVRRGGNGYFHLWQKRFYDTVIRDETHLYRARKYVLQNPLAWRIGRFGIPEGGYPGVEV